MTFFHLSRALHNTYVSGALVNSNFDFWYYFFSPNFHIFRLSTVFSGSTGRTCLVLRCQRTTETTAMSAVTSFFSWDLFPISSSLFDLCNSTPMSIQRPLNESWDCMLPGPPSRSNGGSADLSTTGLLAYASGSSVAVVETHSMQLVTAIPLPPPSSSSAALSPFITSVRWSPHPLPHFLLSSDAPNQHLILAVGDRQGRICLLDLRSKTPLLFFDTSSSNSSSKPGIQDLCWVQTGPDSWAIAALSGPSLLSLYNTSTGRCFFKYDASPEYFSCLRRDPFDFRRFCALGLKGFLLSVKALGDSENDISHKELQIRTDTSELQKLERDSTAAVNGAPALATFPNYIVSSSFSPHWKHILFVTFPRELVVFDLQYETILFSAGLPRGCGKFLEVLPDTNMEVLYCAHLDGLVSIWRRKK